MQFMEKPRMDRALSGSDLISLGYGEEMAAHILSLLEQEDVLEHYLNRGMRAGCSPVSRVSDNYPQELRQKLGLESPGCLWAKGDLALLERPKIALVGSRDISALGGRFAREVGIQAARQGYVLVSGNARGADRMAQNACLENGGSVICVIADGLKGKISNDRILYLSETGFDEPFSPQRAISRNRVIHALAEKTFVAQCGYQTGGTWDGTVKNLRHAWSAVFCNDDGSCAMTELQQMGAVPVSLGDLSDIAGLQIDTMSFF